MKYFSLTFLLLAVFFSVESCQNKKTNRSWELIDFNKIPGETLLNNFFDALSKYRFNQILVLNKDQVILLGDNSGDSDEDYSAKEKEAVVFVSADGGKTLKKHVLGKGTLREAVSAGHIVVLVNENKGSSQLIKALPSFDKWEVTQEFKNEEINNINFYSTTIGVASFYRETSDQEAKSEIRYTLDGGKTWKNMGLYVSDGFGAYVFASANEIEYIEANQLIRFNFITGERTVSSQKIAPEGYVCEGSYFRDPVSRETYTYLEKASNKELSLKNLKTQEVTPLPKGSDHLEIFGDYYYTMVQKGAYYNYVWTADKGKTWHTEELRDFFVTSDPIGYYGKGYTYALVTLFNAKTEAEKGGRFAIRKPSQ
ncbi:hypothetical protein [Flavobacterium cerinum]|uniref:Exo-alpha-sialidase n=1 Tax=Flavobacterium cerinum TaxID=2502784 RepID=A0A3S3Q8X3_9FLAO|nr:hypothetical protein [Flavobacterium cerinum]RWX00319.1 hypothetical protein EPI11_08555 [Flavobacterium cerinum]